MKAMVLAAGLGTRLRPLTDSTPKPLLPLAGKPMIQHHLERLVASGVREIVINVSYLGDQIEAFVGDGAWLGASVRYSREPEGPLDTGGGIRRARALLGANEFLLVAGDVWTDYPYRRLVERPLEDGVLGRLVLVPNPPQHTDGDFRLDAGGWLRRSAGAGEWVTYAGIARLAPALIDGYEETVFPLREPLRAAAERGQLCGELWEGDWEDVGTPERYYALRSRLQSP